MNIRKPEKCNICGSDEIIRREIVNEYWADFINNEEVDHGFGDLVSIEFICNKCGNEISSYSIP